MDYNCETLVVKKTVQKELLNQLCNKGLIDLTDACSIIKKLEEDISKIKKNQKKNENMKNIIIKIPI